jgi:glycine cleavage system regulatory protein
MQNTIIALSITANNRAFASSIADTCNQLTQSGCNVLQSQSAANGKLVTVFINDANGQNVFFEFNRIVP